LKILSIECSATPASVAICDSESKKVLSYSYSNVALTHSQTLMPMIDSTLKSSKLTLEDIEGISVSAGPGSFTGVRIGISIVKGLAHVSNIPCVATSSLLSMAYSFIDEDITVCCVMDARCNQFYNGIFKIENGVVLRLCEDRAISCDDLIDDIKSIKSNIVICGDGADLFYEKVSFLKNVKLASANLKYQSAVGVAFASFGNFESNDTITSKELLPIYLRLPQAERELKEKIKKG